ncbi:MAG: glycosyltransferase, partial [Candidatus Aminicenantes bacterium]|nr:glycosyltransferase [Candidatus Aminicenantes bacterium]
TFILDQIVSLISSGHDVEIFAVKDPGEAKTHALVSEYQLLSRTSYFPRIPGNKLFRVIKGIFLFLLNFHRNPSRLLKCIHVIKFGRDALSLNLLYYNIPFLNRTFDILHCHFGQNGIIGSFIKKISPEVKLVTTFHGYDMSEFLETHGIKVYGDLFAHCDLCLPISDYWKQKLVRLGCKPEKIRVHHMGINLEQFTFRKRQKPEPENMTVLTIGRLVEKKGHEYVIRAMATVLTKHKNLRYIIAGNGPLRDKLKILTDELGIQEYVEFFGECNQTEVFELYRQSHLFVLASITSASGDQEGIPVVLMEAQAVGLPVVSTIHSGIPEGVCDGKSGFLVSEKDSNALGERILYLLENPDIWPAMGQEGRFHVEQHFDRTALNSRLEEILIGLIENR